jgi:hypothetical protein
VDSAEVGEQAAKFMIDMYAECQAIENSSKGKAFHEILSIRQRLTPLFNKMKSFAIERVLELSEKSTPQRLSSRFEVPGVVHGCQQKQFARTLAGLEAARARGRSGGRPNNGSTEDNHGVARPRISRSFSSFSQAAEENGQSRIYLGIHWSFDKTEALKNGRQIADIVSSSF